MTNLEKRVLKIEDRPIINPMGYSIFMYLKNGGCIGTWKRTLQEALKEIQTFKPHDGIIIVKTRYSNRANRHVIQRARNLDDSGIYPKEKRSK